MEDVSNRTGLCVMYVDLSGRRRVTRRSRRRSGEPAIDSQGMRLVRCQWGPGAHDVPGDAVLL